MLIRTILPAGAFHARPDRIGRTNSSIHVLGACCIAWYTVWSTARGEPFLGRYAGLGVGIGLRADRRAAPSASVADAISED